MARIGTPIGRRPRGDDACLSSADRRRQGRASTIHGVERLHMRRCDQRERKLALLRLSDFGCCERERPCLTCRHWRAKSCRLAPPRPKLSGASRMDRRAASVGAATVSAGARAVSAGSVARLAGAGGVSIGASTVSAGAEAAGAVSPAVSVDANAVSIGSTAVSAGSMAESAGVAAASGGSAARLAGSAGCRSVLLSRLQGLAVSPASRLMPMQCDGSTAVSRRQNWPASQRRRLAGHQEWVAVARAHASTRKRSDFPDALRAVSCFRSRKQEPGESSEL